MRQIALGCIKPVPDFVPQDTLASTNNLALQFRWKPKRAASSFELGGDNALVVITKKTLGLVPDRTLRPATGLDIVQKWLDIGNQGSSLDCDPRAAETVAHFLGNLAQRVAHPGAEPVRNRGHFVNLYPVGLPIARLAVMRRRNKELLQALWAFTTGFFSADLGMPGKLLGRTVERCQGEHIIWLVPLSHRHRAVRGFLFQTELAFIIDCTNHVTIDKLIGP